MGPQHWWPAGSAFEVVVGAYLTQNTAWTNVERAMGNLARGGGTVDFRNPQYWGGRAGATGSSGGIFPAEGGAVKAVCGASGRALRRVAGGDVCASGGGAARGVAGAYRGLGRRRQTQFCSMRLAEKCLWWTATRDASLNAMGWRRQRRGTRRSGWRCRRR